MSCCAMPGGCDDPECYMCVVMPQLFEQPADRRERAVKNATRDGEYNIRDGKSRDFTKRSHRAGPNWVPHARRVGG